MYPKTRSEPSCIRVRTAPDPNSLASVWSWNGLSQAGRAKIGGDVRARISVAKALSCSSPHGTLSPLARFDAKRLSRRIFEIGAQARYIEERISSVAYRTQQSPHFLYRVGFSQSGSISSISDCDGRTPSLSTAMLTNCC